MCSNMCTNFVSSFFPFLSLIFSFLIGFLHIAVTNLFPSLFFVHLQDEVFYFQHDLRISKSHSAKFYGPLDSAAP